MKEFKSNLIIFDFEVFSNNVLFGCKYVTEDGDFKTFQTWDLNEIVSVYKTNVDSIWVGHNNENYDNYILQAIVERKTEEQIKYLNDEIIQRRKKPYLRIKLYYYDTMKLRVVSLKTLEACLGKNISLSEVDFNIGRRLTEGEKRLTEKYNEDDLEQTLYNFTELYDVFNIRLEIIEQFNLSLNDLSVTGTQIAEKVLGAKKIAGIEKRVRKPEIFNCLKLKNQDVIDFYMTEKFKTSEKLKFNVCDVEHTLGSGGLHGARKKYSTDKALYFDVSGYYNLIMMNFDLLPRSIPEKGKELYKYMYNRQLELKKIAPTSNMRGAYKVILLSVFGAMTNEYCKFYDPYHGELVTIVGQIFLVDLLEKLEGYVELIQSNTDGIIAKPLEGVSNDKIKDIVSEWENRTGFNCSFDEITDIMQRDVNCYMYQKDGKINVKGDAVKHYNIWETPLKHGSATMKEPAIITHSVVDYYSYGILPEETVSKNKLNLRMFQYVCNKNSYEYLNYELTTICETSEEKMTSPSRAFALKEEGVTGTVYKIKNGSKAKIANMPNSVFIYNSDIRDNSVADTLSEMIDYDYYVCHAYECIAKMKNFTKIKKVTI